MLARTTLTGHRSRTRAGDPRKRPTFRGDVLGPNEARPLTHATPALDAPDTNAPPPPSTDHWHALSVYTWNARALLAYDVEVARCEWAVVQAASTNCEVVCVQEAHGDSHALALAAARLDATHMGAFSAGEAADIGGLLTWFRNPLLRAPAVQTHTLVAGRVLLTSATLEGGARLTVVNVHNVNVPREAIAALARLAAEARQDVQHTFILTGDFNFEEDEEPTDDARPPRGTTRRWDPERRRWLPLLRVLTAHTHRHATRFGAADDGTLCGRASSLDRAYSALPPHRLALSRVWVQIGDARVPDRRGDRPALSEHRPLITIWTPRHERPAHLRPVPEWVARSPEYAHMVGDALRVAGPDLLPAPDAIRRVKQLMRVAAARARDAIMARNPEAALSRRHLALQTIRALQRDDMRTLTRTLREWPALTQALRADHDDRTATVTDADLLRRLLADAKSAPHNAAPPSGMPRRRQRRHARRHNEAQMRKWSGPWVPHRQRRWLSGVTVERATLRGRPPYTQANAMLRIFLPTTGQSALPRRGRTTASQG